VNLVRFYFLLSLAVTAAGFFGFRELARQHPDAGGWWWWAAQWAAGLLALCNAGLVWMWSGDAAGEDDEGPDANGSPGKD
jgi:hypothetical protein